LEQILSIDAFDNDTKSSVPGGDSRPDFINERFVFLGDQANMPYGNYPVVGKTNLLKELIVRDAAFLTGSGDPGLASAGEAGSFDSAVKVIVIACNTATAHGKRDIECFLADREIDIEVIGVVGAGAKGALDTFHDGAGGTIGVLATEGTVLSGAYPREIHALATKSGLRGRIIVVQQGAYGLAGAIDGDPSFIDRSPDSHRTRSDYRGPSMADSRFPIDAALLRRYDFDFSNRGMLYDGCAQRPTALQLNSVENYIAYHVVALVEQLRRAENPHPLRAVVLGCTHFPFFKDAFRGELTRLYNYQENGEFVYRRFLAQDVELIDPAYCTAEELHAVLTSSRKHRSGVVDQDMVRAEFFITVPDRADRAIELTPQGWFTYEYKYGRDGGIGWSDVETVPLGSPHVSPQTLRRLASDVPHVWELIEEFHKSDAKTGSQ
jgi:glutamate racemase